MISNERVAVTIVVVLFSAAAILAYFNNGAGTLEIRVSNLQDLGEATQVCLNYSTVEIHQAQADNQSGWVTVIGESDWINLTKAGDVNRTICYANLQAGAYDQIRLKVLGAWVTVEGVNRSALVSDRELMTSIPNNMKLNTGQTATLLIQINVKVKQTDTLSAGSVTLVPEIKITKK